MTDTPTTPTAATPEELAPTADMRASLDRAYAVASPTGAANHLAAWANNHGKELLDLVDAQAAQIAELTAEVDRAGKWLPIGDDIKVDGQQVLGLVKWEWDTQPRRRIIVWNNGIGKAAYNWPCWMCAVTTTSLPDAIVLAYQPLPSLPEV